MAGGAHLRRKVALFDTAGADLRVSAANPVLAGLVLATLRCMFNPSCAVSMPTCFIRRAAAAVLCASALLATTAARAQSEASIGLSMLPVASVVDTASVAGATASSVVAVPAALLVSGAVLTVRAVEVSARGTVFVLERVSDGAVASVELGAAAARGVALGAGASVVSTVIASGVILSAAGEVLCFVPNAVGRALLHNERIL